MKTLTARFEEILDWHPAINKIEGKTQLEWLIQAVREYNKEVIPSKADVRPEITEWTFSKNRDAAKAYNEAIETIEKRQEELL